jgi:hypothetical protein
MSSKPLATHRSTINGPYSFDEEILWDQISSIGRRSNGASTFFFPQTSRAAAPHTQRRMPVSYPITAHGKTIPKSTGCNMTHAHGWVGLGNSYRVSMQQRARPRRRAITEQRPATGEQLLVLWWVASPGKGTDSLGRPTRSPATPHQTLGGHVCAGCRRRPILTSLGSHGGKRCPWFGGAARVRHTVFMLWDSLISELKPRLIRGVSYNPRIWFWRLPRFWFVTVEGIEMTRWSHMSTSWRRMPRGEWGWHMGPACRRVMPKPAVWAAWENWAGAVATQLGPRCCESGPSACSFCFLFYFSSSLSI